METTCWRCLGAGPVLSACSAEPPAVPMRCSDGELQAPTDQGDEALCRVPRVVCSGAGDLMLVSQCHLEPSPAPATACCDARPAACAPTDGELLADAGVRGPYSGPKGLCSDKLSCWPATDGGAPTISCTPA